MWGWNFNQQVVGGGGSVTCAPSFVIRNLWKLKCYSWWLVKMDEYFKLIITETEMKVLPCFVCFGCFYYFYIYLEIVYTWPANCFSFKNSEILANGFCSFCLGKKTTWVEFICRFRPCCRSVFLVLDSACYKLSWLTSLPTVCLSICSEVIGSSIKPVWSFFIFQVD